MGNFHGQYIEKKGNGTQNCWGVVPRFHNLQSVYPYFFKQCKIEDGCLDT